MVFFRDYQHLILSTLAILVPQIILAYVSLDLLIPKLLNRKKRLLFAFSLLLTLILLFVGYVLIRKYYFDVIYIDTYNDLTKKYATLPLVKRLLDPSLFFSKAVKFLTPAALLYTYQLFKNQQEMLKLREQKQAAELNALKNQLNPHFLFNTLNNLYTLALERSERTPEVIERLSEMLDYMLYRCKDNFVSIEKEISAIENYLALEKIRYGKRVDITFENHLQTPHEIAPLILITLIENAFKHGVSQELFQAQIKIILEGMNDYLLFSITNTKPKSGEGIHKTRPGVDALGLKNITKQLDLLYPENYLLDIQDEEDSFNVQLKIPFHGI